ncbi:bifunctional folylpolyglutamate synthase/dihydrofolate synthase [Rikenella microfusus]|uniref:bifunctional folylpolyglutamate synthase/dihydrofolate synthase n=1 Tax=Rikenella microfusus TaxID=28139 RepID=UPI001DD90E5E|nr:folylpolyglutamate synthase/dihydrofolate synthase family protein [Rikenella microfusus]HJE88864.1 bifunctional folylpolyglutamate synthase/dihydrofolate synthase [Rikenella microfusus]
MTYPETIEYLYAAAPMFQSVGGKAYKEGLETTVALNALLGNPYEAFRSVHVGGTNGKGSVSQMLCAVLREAGYKVGLYTSPHLKDFRERIQADGRMIPERDVIDFIERMRPHIETLRPSFFEITTAMAFDFFRQQQTDIAVVEVGMGGRLDCTNVITPLASVITNISFDHMQFLGDTLPKIAGEKAGIIKPGVPVVVGESRPETAPTFIAKAREADSPIVFADQRYRCAGHDGRMFEIESLTGGYRFTIQLGMEGDYQQRNLCTALAALDALTDRLPRPLTTMQVRRGLAEARVPGRWQNIATGSDPCPIICDTGHNEAGLAFVTEQLERQSREKLYFVLGVVADKDLDRILPLLPRDAHYIFTQARLPRALRADTLADRARAAGLRGEVAASVPEALAKARSLASAGDLIFVGGSTFTVAEVL